MPTSCMSVSYKPTENSAAEITDSIIKDKHRFE